MPGSRFLYFTTKAERAYTAIQYRPGDCLVFGSETRGSSERIATRKLGSLFDDPDANREVRSLNLATSVGIVLYEALRQLGSTDFSLVIRRIQTKVCATKTQNRVVVNRGDRTPVEGLKT